ncbi:MAG: type III secretion system cytoplasmic ring protein SctQ [Desulfobacterales bacterium]|nr:type III secretion system cytoplasmic ring protein SctQ [Desulfobacterales bacterium]
MKRLNLFKTKKELLPIINLIYKKNTNFFLEINNEEYLFYFVIKHTETKDKIQIKFVLGNSNYFLEIENIFLTNLIDNFLEGENYINLPEIIKTAILENIFTNIIDKFENWSGLKLNILKINLKEDINIIDISDESRFDILFQLTNINVNNGINGRIVTDFDNIEFLKALIEKLPDELSFDFEQIPFTFFFEIAKTKLDFKNLKDLNPNDIIFFDEFHLTANNSTYIKLSKKYFALGILENNSITIEKFMNDSDYASEDNQESSFSFDDLEVEIVFEIGKQSLTLKEIKELKQGIIFNLQKPIEKSVTIKANNKIIGFGELVDIEDNIGVRIIELAN